MPRHFLRDDDLTSSEQAEVLALADAQKRDRTGQQPLAGPRAVAVVFDKPSTRTRVSFSVGVAELGGYQLVIDAQSTQLGRGEPIEDTARVLDRQCAAIVWRAFGQDRIQATAAVSRVPVVNALTDTFHPCHDPDPAILARAAEIAAATGGSASHVRDPQAAVDGSDVLATDVLATDTWVSMGQEGEKDDRSAPFVPYAVDEGAHGRAADGAVVLHRLPACRGKEIAGRGHRRAAERGPGRGGELPARGEGAAHLAPGASMRCPR